MVNKCVKRRLRLILIVTLLLSAVLALFVLIPQGRELLEKQLWLSLPFDLVVLFFAVDSAKFIWGNESLKGVIGIKGKILTGCVGVAAFIFIARSILNGGVYRPEWKKLLEGNLYLLLHTYLLLFLVKWGLSREKRTEGEDPGTVE